MQNFELSAFADEASPLLYEQIDAMRENSVTLLEMRGVNGRNVADMTREEVQNAAHQLSAAGLSVWSIGSPIGKIKVTDPFEGHLNKFKRVLEAATLCGAPCLRLFSFYGVKSDGEKDEAIERLSRMAEVAKGSGVLLCHENEKGIYGDDPDSCLEILTALPSLGSVFDPANFIQCGVDPWTAWEKLADRTTYLHIKDALPDGKVVPAGCGVGQVAAIVADFGKRGGKVLSLEPHLTVFSGLSDLEAGTKTEIDPYAYPNARAAFKASADALKKILEAI